MPNETDDNVVEAPADEAAVPVGFVPVNIVKSFTYTHSDTRQQEFIHIGTHNYPEMLTRDHFFMSHSDTPPPAIIPGGTRAYAEAQMAAMRRRELAKAALEQQVHEAALAIRTHAQLSGALVEAEEKAHTEEIVATQEAAQQAEVGQAIREGRRPQVLPPRGRNTV
jgi:hypothetical protein